MLTASIEGRSRKTKELYQYVFESFTRFLGSEDVALETITIGDIRRYLAHLQGKGLALTTISIHLRTLKTFFSSLVRDGLMGQNPARDIRNPKLPKLYPKTIPDHAVAAILKACDQKRWEGLRNYTMLLVLLDCGLRLTELLNLTLADLSLPTRTLMVIGKGSKERIVPFGRQTAKSLNKWLKVRGVRAFEDRLFISRSGDPLKPRGFQQAIERLAKKAGIEGVQISPHCWRHTFASRYIMNGGGPFTLQNIMGHSSIKTTMRYVHMSGEALRRAHVKASPVDRLME